MTTAASDHISLVSLSTTMTQQGSKKRQGPTFVPHGAKKRRGLVSRTHSPRSETSPLSSPYLHTTTTPKTPPREIRIKVRKVAPTVGGVAEAARLMGNGGVVILPTETVYMACTSIRPRRQEEAQEALNELRTLCKQGDPILVVQRPVQTLERFVSFPVKPYAVKKPDGKATAPVIFSERKEVLNRLTKKFWPGPVSMYITSDTKCSTTLPKCAHNETKFIGLSNPSHPLTNRLLKEAAASSEDNVIVGMAPRLETTGSYMTTGISACAHFGSQCLDEEHTVHVLNGEDKRELFSVPTCQYGGPCKHSLWIDESCRTVYIRGTTSDVMKKDSVIRALLAGNTSPVDDEKLRNRNRVMTAVVRKWRVVDERK